MTQVQLQQYFDNKCTPEEKAIVENWLLSASEEHINTLMKERWNQIGGKMPEHEKKVLWQRLHKNIVPAPKTSLVKTLQQRSRAVAAAAAVIILLAVATFWLTVQNNREYISNDSPVAKQVKLADGTIVWLNAWSELTYYKDFNDTSRKVKINGEAYFIVKEDKSKPFTVYAGHIATNVLGTEFNVEAYENEKSVKVSLTKGKVAISFRDNQETSDPVKYLSPGEMFTSTADKNISVQPIAVQKAQAWMEGYFVVNDLNLQEVLNRMEKRYNIRFHIEGGQMPASACEHVAATFAGENWQQIVKQLCFTCHFEYTIEGQDVHLTYTP